MNRNLWLAAAVVLGACSGEGTDKTDELTDPVECDNEFEASPTDGGSLYYRGSIVLEFDDPEDITVTMADAAGTAVNVDIVWSGDEATVTPTAPLAPSTEYTVTVGYSCGDASFSLTTTEVGAPIADPSTLVDRTWMLDITSPDLRITEPPGVGALLQGLIASNAGEFEILVGVSAYDAGMDQLSILGALGTGAGAQDMCTESLDFPVPADFSEAPYMEVAGDLVPITVAGFTVNLQDLVIGGSFSPDGSYIQGVSLGGVIDARDLASVAEELGGSLCQVVGDLTGGAVACEPCADTEVQCLRLQIENIPAEEVPGVTLMPRSTADIEADAVCTPPAEVIVVQPL